MKKVLVIIWTLALVVFFFFSVRHLITEKDKAQIIPPYKSVTNKSTEVFSVHTFDSLMASNEYVLLTLAFGDCSVCDTFLSTKIPEQFPVARYYIDATHDNNNMLVLQSLYFTGFPLSYVIDQNRNIIGSIKGLVCLRERLDSIVYGQHQIQPETIPGVPKEKTFTMLSNSFKGLLSYMGNNHEEMKKQAKASLSEGSFFFNNYLMYKYYDNVNCVDSVNHYKKKILKNITTLEAFVYENLLTELDPHNPMLHHTHNHTHN